MAAAPISPEGARGNRLLAALPEAAWARLRPELEVVQLRLKEPFHEAGRPIRHVHFPITSVASMVATLQEAGVVEVATIGNEGLVGLPVLLGAATSPMTTFLQIPGPTARLPAAALRAEVAGAGRWSRCCTATPTRSSPSSRNRWRATGCTRCRRGSPAGC